MEYNFKFSAKSKIKLLKPSIKGSTKVYANAINNGYKYALYGSYSYSFFSIDFIIYV